jgi:hypothetical protein
MSENPDRIQMVAQERFKEFHKMADQHRLARLCREDRDRGLFRNAVCMLAQRMIAIGTYLLSRYGDSSEANEATGPIARRRRRAI